MENFEKSVYPITNEVPEGYEGLTKREYFAGLAMQGLLTRNDGNPQLGILESKRIAEESVIMANTLLEKLNNC